MSRLKKTSEVAEVKKTEVNDEAKASPSPTSYKPFIEIIEEPVLARDVLTVYDAITGKPWNLVDIRYRLQWCPEREMAGNRFGHWLTVDKHHPDFKNMRVMVDHSPSESFVRNGDLILCATRKETWEKWHKAANQESRRSDKRTKSEYQREIDDVDSGERSDGRGKHLKVL